MSRMCTEKQLVFSESQSESPQGQISEPSIAAQISDTLQALCTRICEIPSSYFTEGVPKCTQRLNERGQCKKAVGSATASEDLS